MSVPLTSVSPASGTMPGTAECDGGPSRKRTQHLGMVEISKLHFLPMTRLKPAVLCAHTTAPSEVAAGFPQGYCFSFLNVCGHKAGSCGQGEQTHCVRGLT